MESFTRYLSSLTKYKDRIFFSSPPDAALIIWSNIGALPAITGISLVSDINSKNEAMPRLYLLDILKRHLPNEFPIIDVVYDFQNSFLLIGDVKFPLEEGALRLGSLLNIRIGNGKAKAPNNLDMITDSFHLWSRDVFDGQLTKKTDIDLLIVKDNVVDKIIEIKRSNKIKVGSWNPYIVNDGPNYLMQISLCKMLSCDFITVHHEEMNESIVFNGDESVDLFIIASPIGEVNRQLLRDFSDNSNRRSGRISEFIS
jgi:hypothetical protein